MKAWAGMIADVVSSSERECASSVCCRVLVEEERKRSEGLLRSFYRQPKLNLFKLPCMLHNSALSLQTMSRAVLLKQYVECDIVECALHYCSLLL